MALDIVSLLGGGAAGVLIGALGAAAFILPRVAALRAEIARQDEAQAAMEKTFMAAAQQALDRNSAQFMQLAQEKLKHAQADGAHDLEKRQIAINELLKPVHKQLETLGGAVEQIKGTDNALREDMKHLARETARLAGALRDPAAQGRWGEFILEGLLDKSGLMKGVHYETQLRIAGAEGGTQRPDAVIRMQDGLSIVVDAKAPLNEFADKAHDAMSQDEFDTLTANLARQVRAHVTALGRKGYWQAEELQSPDFTILFLPSEHLFSMALRADPALVDHALSQNVLISSPTSFMALLRVVALGWRQGDLARNAQDIAAQGAELYKRLTVFAAHMEKVGKGIAGAMGSYNDAVGSLERNVLSSARKLKDLNVVTAGKELPAFSPLRDEQRHLTAAELLADPEKLEKTRANG